MMEFLSLSKEVFGLEITDRMIRIMEVEMKGSRIVTTMAGCFAVEEGVIKNGDIKDEAKLAETIKKVVAQCWGKKMKTHYVAVSLPDNKAFLQVMPMPKLQGEELRAAVIFEAENYIPMPLEKVYLDFEIANIEGNSTHCEAVVVALPKEIVDSRVRVLDKAGLMPIAMELESQAAARALLSGGEERGTVMIIQIGDSKTNIVICLDGLSRFTFSIPISNNYFLETIMASADVDLKEAESLKVKCGIEQFMHTDKDENSGPGKEPNSERRRIFELLVPGLVDFVQQIQKCIQYYQTHEKREGAGKKALFERMILCGSGSNLKGLDEFISLKLNTKAEQRELPVDMSGLKIKTACENSCGYAVVAGLAMRGLSISGNIGKKMPRKLKIS